MELQVILGPNSSGKSLYAEQQAVETGGPLVYLATMIPQNEENLRRIEKHRLQRRNKGFRTVECGWNLDQVPVSPEEVVLLEDVSNLVANGIFVHGASGDEALRQILSLAKRCRRVIAVTIEGLSEEGYDGETAAYIRSLNQVNEALLRQADQAFEMHSGKPHPIK